MEENKNSSGQVLKLIGIIFLSAGMVISSSILGNSIIRHKVIGVNGKSSISATGSASIDFESYLIVWRGTFSRSAENMKKAYSLMKKDVATIKNYLEKNGIKSDEYLFSSIDINQETRAVYNENGVYVRDEFIGYNLSQSVVISSKDLDKVELVSRDISQLIDENINLDSSYPEYYYSKLDELKLSLIEAATENSKQRIEIIAKASGAKVGELINSNLGVFQITAQNSGTGSYSYEGNFDTSSRIKTANITVKLDYTIK